MRRWLLPLAAGLCALCLAACASQLSWPDQPNSGAPGAIPLNAATTIGQTFVALEDGLDGVDVYLSPQGAPQGDIQLALLPAPQTPGADVVVATASLPASAVAAPGYYHFAFASHPGLRLHTHYLRL